MKSLIPLGFLAIALATLAALQYKWIGEVSKAEQQSLKNGLRESSEEFARDFSLELGRLVGAIQIRDAYQIPDLAPPLTRRYQDWAQSAMYPTLLDTLYVTRGVPGQKMDLSRLDWGAGQLDPIAWPPELMGLKTEFERNTPPERGPRPGPPLKEAAVIVVPLVQSNPGRGAPPGGPERGGFPRYGGGRGEPRRGPPEYAPEFPPEGPTPGIWAIAKFRESAITGELLPALVQRHFPKAGGSRYNVAIVEGNDGRIIYTSSDSWKPDLSVAADEAIDLFSPEPPGGPRGGDRGPGPNRGRGRGRDGERGPIAGRGEGPRRGGQPEGPAPARVAFAGQYWRLLVKHEAGSVGAAVESARRRNLAVSFGVLLVLAGAAGTAVVLGQRARSLARQQMEFAAGVSHELRTPLAVIQSAAHNLGAGIVRDPEAIEEYAGIVQKEARRLSTMVEQVMAYAETQSGRKRYDVWPVDVRDVVDQARKSFSLADDTDVMFEQRIADDLPPVLGDPSALTQCLGNLLSNAAKYGRAQNGACTVEIEARFDNGARKLHLSVLDRGSGVPAGDVRKLFEPFHRGSNAQPNTPGNGLGLHLVRSMMEAQGGAIEYEPRPGGGACFTLIVPGAESTV